MSGELKRARQQYAVARQAAVRSLDNRVKTSVERISPANVQLASRLFETLALAEQFKLEQVRVEDDLKIFETAKGKQDPLYGVLLVELHELVKQRRDLLLELNQGYVRTPNGLYVRVDYVLLIDELNDYMDALTVRSEAFLSLHEPPVTV